MNQRSEVAGELTLPFLSSASNLSSFPFLLELCSSDRGSPASPVLRGKKFPLLKWGWALHLFCPLFVPLRGIQDGKISCGFTESQSPVFIAGRRLRGEGDDHVCPGWAQSPGWGWGVRED